MITFVNTVLVGTGVGTIASTIAGATKGQYVVVDGNGRIANTAALASAAESLKVGIATGKTINYRAHNGSLATTKEIKWSHIIKKADIKSYHYSAAKEESEDTVTFDFTPAVTAAADKDIRVVVRLTFKDMPTRYRKWSESYEVFAKAGSTAKAIVDEFVSIINIKDGKRARVIASNNSDALQVVAMPYTDDDVVDSISPANKIRFNGNAWYTVPDADGFESNNKYTAATIEKVPGVWSTTNAKLVRDAEAQAMGYEGILNRGEGTWPIIKPGMNVELDEQYDGITLEFENRYRAADDIFRHTRNTLQIFEQAGKTNNIKAVLDAFVSGKAADATAADINNGTSDIID